MRKQFNSSKKNLKIFDNFECNIKFTKYPDTFNIVEFYLHYFEWIHLDLS